MELNLYSTKNYRIPSYLASYIVYGDETGLTSDEIEEYQNFLDKIKKIGDSKLRHVSLGEELGFYHKNDINYMGGECIELIANYELYIKIERPNFKLI